MLPTGDVEDEPVQRVGNVDLAGKPAVIAEIFCKLQKLCFHLAFHGAANLVDPGRIDIDMAGGAGADPAAIPVNAGNVIGSGAKTAQAANIG